MVDMNLDLGRGSALGAVVGLFGDFLLNSGELVALVVSWLVGNADLLLPIFTTLRGQIAPHIAWISADALDSVVFAAAALFLLVMLYRLTKRTVGE